MATEEEKKIKKSAFNKAYREANSEKIKALKKAHREANPEKYKARDKAYREANPEKIKTKNKADREANPEKYKAYEKAHREANPEKIESKNRLARADREINPEKYKAYITKYRKSNPEKHKARDKAYREANPEKYKAYITKYRESKKNDPMYILICAIRNSIRKSIKRKNFKKTSKTYEILGCTFEEFKIYIDSLLEPWMNLDNYGLYNGELNYGWDLDHIIAMATAKTIEDVIRLNHYTNFQPLCSKVNRDIKKANSDYKK